MKRNKLNAICSRILLGYVGVNSHLIYAAQDINDTQNSVNADTSVKEAKSATLEVIQVTSQKRLQTLQEVPATVTAVSGDEIAEYGIDDLFEIAALVPGMVFSRAPDDGLALTLRGLGTPARTQSFDQSVALFQDGMFLGKGRMYSTAFFDVERIEVIKGTQSTLLGKNTSLGAISIMSKRPSGDFDGNITAGVEVANGGWSLDGGVNIPVSDDFNVRVAGHLVQQQGWVTNLATGRDVPEDDDIGVRVTAQYTPTDSLTVTGIYQHSVSERIGNGYQWVDNGGYLSQDVLDLVGEADLDDTKTALCIECPNEESFHETNVDSFNLTIEYDLDDHTFTSVTSSATYDISFFDDFDFGNAIDEVTYVTTGEVEYYSTYFERNETYDQFSQEFRLASNGGEKLDYMFGLFYFNSDWDSLEEQFFNTPNFPPVGPVGQIFNGSFGNDFKQETETLSAFAQSDMYITDSITFSAGLRYTDESKDVIFNRIQGSVATLWNTVINPPFESELYFEDSFLNGNMSLKYELSRNTVLYTSYGLGSKTGGFAESAEVTSGDPSLHVSEGGAQVKSEETQTYEMGSKMVLFDSRMNLNAALFYSEIENFQETSFLVTDESAGFLTQNVDVKSTGIELDGKYQLTPDLRINGAITYADTVHVDDGSDLAQAPKLTGNIGYFYDTEISSGMILTSSGDIRHRGKMVSQINETYPSDSLTTADLTLGLASAEETWKVMLIVQNITNARASEFSGPPAAPIGAVLGAPTGDQGITAETLNTQRMIKLQFSYNFFD
ncbi:TonB-dependent receptor [uncultured Paraglaciecola sp.]|uniref:TonB-dependent receptor n=1 Tax=uncultured Paraglaciecola sp. TaxID=1765024 RepID=UPI002597EA62|nr:TonB-dependent receptor [uncultured Paraglaciecola sp.]